MKGRDTDWFCKNNGVRQGCVPDPDLFNCVIDYLMTKVCKEVPGVSFANYHLANLEYVDNTTLFSNSTHQLRNSLTVNQEEAAKLSLQVSRAKTKLVHVHPYSILALITCSLLAHLSI